MDRVLDRLFIGDAADVAGRVPLGALGFVGVVDLRDGDHGRTQVVGAEVHRIENRDGDPWTVEQVRGAVEFIHRQIQKGRVLVVCWAGMSRSACITIGYLVRCGWSVAEAVECVRRARPEIAPVERMLASVLQAIGEETTAGRIEEGLHEPLAVTATRRPASTAVHLAPTEVRHP